MNASGAERPAPQQAIGDRTEELTAFHHTISEQLNARLAESPRFFGVLVITGTAYGYVLWKFDQGKVAVFLLASVLTYAALLWAVWYLAALGYAFRYLQYSQHRIEDALGWDCYRPEGTGKPPDRIRSIPKLFWLLPGIYHAHGFGLCIFLLIVVGAFYWHLPVSQEARLASFPLLLASTGLLVVAANLHYLRKFRDVYRRSIGRVSNVARDRQHQLATTETLPGVNAKAEG